MLLLLVDDDDRDAFMFERSMQTVAPTARCHRVKTPAEAHWYLLGLGRFSDRDRYPLPRIVVVYMAMRGGTGAEFLEWLRAQSDFDNIRLCLFSRAPLDPAEEELFARATGCAFSKPESDEEWNAILQRIIASELAEHRGGT
jgi:CheY-like chemotaxis protein